MSDKTIAQKLLVKEGNALLVLNAPRGYKAILGALPKNARVLSQAKGPADIIQAFVTSRQELEAALAQLKPMLTPKAILWITYPKGTSKIKSDINRDSINAYAQTVGLQGVAMIAIDDDWSALRLKVIQDVSNL